MISGTKSNPSRDFSIHWPIVYCFPSVSANSFQCIGVSANSFQCLEQWSRLPRLGWLHGSWIVRRCYSCKYAWIFGCSSSTCKLFIAQIIINFCWIWYFKNWNSIDGVKFNQFLFGISTIWIQNWNWLPTKVENRH